MLGDRLKMFRKRADLTQQDVAEKLGISRPAIGQWESGATSPSLDALNTLAAIYGVSRAVLLGDIPESTGSNIEPAPPLGGMAPLISWIQAGAFAESIIELNEDTQYYPRPANSSDQTFVLRVVGESMIDEYKPGTLIFVDPERAAVSGDDVVAALEGTGEATFKRFIEDPGMGKMLKVLNSTWPNQFIPINGNCRIVGVVVAAMWLK